MCVLAGSGSASRSAYDPTRPLIIDPVVVYSTYLGGTGADSGWDIAVDTAGNAYVTGTTEALNFRPPPARSDRATPTLQPPPM